MDQKSVSITKEESQSNQEFIGISVIIAHHNQSDELAECLKSLTKLNYPNYEIIVVDDNSTEEKANKIKQFPVKIITLKENRGSGYARNLAAKNAKFEVLFFIDSDTIMPENVFELINKGIKEGNDGIIGVVDKEALNKGFTSNWMAYETNYLGINSNIANHQFFIALCGAIKKSVYFETGGMFHRYLDDVEFNSRLSTDVKIKTEKELIFKHNYSNFLTCMKKFFIRSYYFLQLDKQNKSPWTDNTRIYSTITALGFALGSPLLFVNYLAIIPISFLGLFSFFSKRFILHCYKDRGIAFAIQSFFLKYSFSLAIGSGSLIGIVAKQMKTVKDKIIEKSGPFRIFLRANSPTYIIQYVTSRCNSRCSYCFQWEILNESKRVNNELSLREFKQLAKSMGVIEHLTLGGGEPFLRSDLADIAINFYQYTKVRNISIPTNGIRPDSLKIQLEKILKNCPKSIIKISLSIDGVGEEHDRLRGVKGNYERLLQSDKVIRELREKYSNCYYTVNTCLNTKNQDTVVKTIHENRKRFDRDEQVVTYVRGSVADGEKSKEVDINKYFDIVEYLDYSQKTEKEKHSYRLSTVHKALQIESRAAISKILTEHKGKYSCTAGKTMVVIDDQGNVNPCEILPNKFGYGNLRDFGMNLKTLMTQAKVFSTQNRIKNEKCFCTWECAQLNSIAFSLKGYFNILKNIRLLQKRKKLLKRHSTDGIMSFEDFQNISKRQKINEMTGEPVHPMVFEGNLLNPFNVTTNIDIEGNVITKVGMTDEELRRKREIWLRPINVERINQP